VTSLVVFIVASLSAYHLATLARLSIKETESRGELLRQAIFQRAREVVPTAKDPYAALQQDGGLRSLLESTGAFSVNVVYATIVNRDGIAVAHNFKSEEGRLIPDQQELNTILDLNALRLLRVVYDDRTFEIRQQLLFGEQEFGTIKIGVSTLLVQSELKGAFKVAAQSVLLALLISTAVAMLLAQWMLRPINVIQSGLTRLGRGELDVRLDLPEGEEFKDLGSSFATISAQLSESRAKASSSSDFESIVDNLEDAVALFSPDGRLIFSNPAMGVLLPEFAAGSSIRLDEMVANDAVRSIVERTLASHQSQGPLSVEHGGSERLLMTHPVDDGQGKFVGAMLVARNLAFMTQVHSTLNYSRKLAALGRLMAGLAHEVKNPLNAMTIHLELLKQKLQRQVALAGSGARAASASASQPDADRRRTGLSETAPGRAESPDVIRHVDVISKEIQRLDLVLTGFLKFARPDELKLQPVQLSTIVSDVVTTVSPEAEHKGVTLKQECPRDLPEVNADPAMLRQALLNLALNGCQAMPEGGTLKIACRPTSDRRVEIDVEDTGVGIAPENLQKIFDLYFTTKDRGTGIGLSMVYRIVQLHDGEIEVQSTPGRGTRFRLVFPQA